MRIHHSAAVSAVLMTLVGVGHAEPPIPVEAPELHNDCPIAMRRATVATKVVTGGVDIEFKTPIRHNLPALRAMVREAAMVIELHSRDIKRISAGEPHHDFPAVDVWVKDIAAGVRVRILAERTKDISELRALALGFQQAWLTSDCVDEPMEPYTGPAVRSTKATN